MPATQHAANPGLRLDLNRLPVLDRLIDSFVKRRHKQFYIVRAHRFGVPFYTYEAGVNTKPYGLRQDCIACVSSITKGVTAVLIMKLVEDGLLDTYDPVINYLPWLGEDKKDIRVWHLLTHTCGIVDSEFRAFKYDFAERVFGLKKPSDDADEKEWGGYESALRQKTGCEGNLTHWFLRRYPLPRAPRAVMSYSSVSSNMLGDIIEAVTGKSIDEFSRQALFLPLGMEDSHFILPEDKYHRVVGRNDDCVGVP